MAIDIGSRDRVGSGVQATGNFSSVLSAWWIQRVSYRRAKKGFLGSQACGCGGPPFGLSIHPLHHFAATTGTEGGGAVFPVEAGSLWAFGGGAGPLWILCLTCVGNFHISFGGNFCTHSPRKGLLSWLLSWQFPLTLGIGRGSPTNKNIGIFVTAI